MHLDEILTYCLSLKGTTETFPFDQRTLVFKVMNKMYGLIDIDDPVSLNLKCDPDRSVELRERYEAVEPGFHMNKKHWNTVYLNKDLGRKEIEVLILHSYELVVKSLPKKLQHELSIG